MLKYEETVAEYDWNEDSRVFTFDEVMREFDDGSYWDVLFGGNDEDLKRAFKDCIRYLDRYIYAR